MPSEGRDGALVAALDHLFLWVRSKRLLLRFTVFAAALLAVFLSTRGFGSVQATNLIIPLGAAAGLFTLLRFCWIVWRGRRAP